MKKYILDIIFCLLVTVIIVISYQTNQSILTELQQLRLQSEATEMEYHAMKESVDELLDVMGVDELYPEPSRGQAYNQDDLLLLATLIDNEARNQPYRGKVAVGAVVVNRVKHEGFGSTISEVILSPGQFCELRYHGQLLPESLEAAIDALNGVDPTQGALYFYNPSSSTCEWIFTTEKIMQIQDHVFAR